MNTDSFALEAMARGAGVRVRCPASASSKRAFDVVISAMLLVIFAPLLLLATVAAWFGMNDIASMKASFADQAVIFRRTHNWIMCWLYTGTFGTFIGMSAGFPLLAATQFPGVDALQFAFLGPLVGALSAPR